MDFNHYLVIPANTQCFIDTLDYGKFDAYLSKYSKVSVLYDTYIMQNGVCVRSYQGIKMLPGSLHGDPYCQIFMTIQLGACEGCSESEKRIEIYSNSDKGCGDEFYVPPPPEPEPIPEPVPEPTP